MYSVFTPSRTSHSRTAFAVNSAPLSRIRRTTPPNEQLGKLAARLKEHGLELVLSQPAKELLLEKGTDEKFGARPLKRCISSMVEDPLSEDILRNKYAGKSIIEVGVQTDPDDEDQKKLKFDGVEGPPKSESKEDVAVAGSETT